MIIFKKAEDIQKFINDQRKRGLSIGFAPTMGALHKGHISLLETCKKQADISVCSIFVNPTQFNDPADFTKYPITIEKDIYMLEKGGCDILFLPSVNEMYPNGFELHKNYDLGYIETILEGKFRPGHFQGVCQVVHRLLEIVLPDLFFLGQKDYQQCMVLKKLIQLTNLPITLIICPTEREKDGLAMSSRNMRLNEVERKKAPYIYQTLSHIKATIQPGKTSMVKEEAIKKLTAEGFNPDYIEIANADNLEPIDEWNGNTKLVLLAAAFLNDVRLIDNMIVD